MELSLQFKKKFKKLKILKKTDKTINFEKPKKV